MNIQKQTNMQAQRKKQYTHLLPVKTHKQNTKQKNNQTWRHTAKSH